MLACCLITETQAGRLSGISTNTAAGQQTTLSGFIECEGRYLDFSNGIKGFIYMISNYLNPNIKFVPLDGSTGSVATFYGATNYGFKVTLNWLEPSWIFFSYYGSNARGFRLNIQLLGSTTTLTAVQQGIAKSGEYSTASVTEPGSNFIYIGGSHDWRYICKYDLTLGLYSNHLNSALLANMGWNKFGGITNANFLAVGGYYAHQLVLNKLDLTLLKNLSNPAVEAGFGLLNNLDSAELYIDGRDLKLTSVDLLLGSTPNHFLKFTPIVFTTAEERGIANLGTLQMLIVGDKVNSEVRVVSKATFKILFVVNYMDGLSSEPNTLRSSSATASSLYFTRIEASNKNIQQYSMAFDNCTYRTSTHLCTNCLVGYYRTNLTGDNECILPKDFPPLYGIDDPNILMMHCGTFCLYCLDNYAFCNLCDNPNFYYGLDGICYSIPTVPNGYGLDLASFLFVRCLQQTECLRCGANHLECSVCDNSAGYYLLGVTCYNFATVPNTFGLNTISLVFQTCASVGCVKCAADRSICTQCNNTQGYFLLNGQCYTLASVPNGFGLDTTLNIFVSCAATGCTNCAANKDTCTSCNNSAGLFILVSICYSTSNVPSKYGLDSVSSKFVDCISFGCLQCSTDYRICSTCDTAGGSYLLNSQCYTTANMPSGYGLDTVSSVIKSCVVAGCLSCRSDFSKCATCNNLAGYYLLSDTCYTISSVPSGFGVDSIVKVMKSCSSTGCIDCGSNYLQCQTCDSALGFFKLGSACYTTVSVPFGFGFNPATNTFAPCAAGSACLDCRGGYTVCSQCSQGYYYLENTQTCYSTLTIPGGHGLDTGLNLFVACDEAPSCTQCSNDYSFCTNCNTDGEVFAFNGKCIQISEIPKGYGVDTVAKVVLPCADKDCEACALDYMKCTRCTASSGKAVESSSCIPIECLNGGCQPKVQSECNAEVRKISYDVVQQNVKFLFSKQLDLFKEYLAVLYLVDDSGEKRAIKEPELFLEFAENTLTATFNVTRPLYEVQLEIHISLLPGVGCRDGSQYQNTSNMSKPMSFSPLVVPLSAAASSVGTTLTLGAGVLSILTGGSRLGIARVIERLFSNFIWLKVLNGPVLLYPEVIFRYLKDDKASLLTIYNPLRKSLQNSTRADCQVYENYERNGITCELMVNYGDELAFLAVVLVFVSLVSGCFAVFKHLQVDRHIASGAIEQAKRNRKSCSFSVFKTLNRFIGVRSFFMDLWANSVRIFCYVCVQYYFSKPGPRTALGFISGTAFCLLFAAFMVASERYVMAHRLAIRRGMENADKEKRPTRSFITYHIEASLVSSKWDTVEFAFERLRVPRKFYLCYHPILDIARAALINFLLLVLSPFGLVQVYAATILQSVHVVYVLRSKIKVTAFERTVDSLTAVLELGFCVGRIASFSDLSARDKQEIVGSALGAIIWLILAVNLVFLISQLLFTFVIEPIHTLCKKKHSGANSVAIARSGRKSISAGDRGRASWLVAKQGPTEKVGVDCKEPKNHGDLHHLVTVGTNHPEAEEALTTNRRHWNSVSVLISPRLAQEPKAGHAQASDMPQTPKPPVQSKKVKIVSDFSRPSTRTTLHSSRIKSVITPQPEQTGPRPSIVETNKPKASCSHDSRPTSTGARGRHEASSPEVGSAGLSSRRS